jgi:hypothetical protein
MEKVEIEKFLKDYLPDSAVERAADLIYQQKVSLLVTRSRLSKHGDFKVEHNGNAPRISVNYNLNPYAFLITLLHELAHFMVWDHLKHKYRLIKPHGTEWKMQFQELMSPFLNEKVFPSPLLEILILHMRNPKASSSSDLKLLKELKRFDKGEMSPVLADFQIGDHFLFRNASFRVIKKNRTRYLCEHLQSKRRYLIHAMAEVEKV